MSKVLLPLPDGFNFEPQMDKVVIQMPNAEETTASGIILAEETRRGEQIDSMIGRVISMGPLAYTDEAIFGSPPTPACRVGDWVMIKKYSGNKFFVNAADGKGKIELRIILDDQILGITSTPEMVRGS